MKKRLTILFVIALVIVNVACGVSYQKLMEKPEAMFYQGQFKEAARELYKEHGSVGSKDEMLILMECGLMLNAAQDYPNSTKVLMKAGKMADKINISISREAAGLLLDQTMTNYKGEDFERVLIHMYLGINFLFMKKPNEARIEFKKVNDVLKDIKVSSSGKTYRQNVMAMYLSAIAFEMSADLEDSEKEKFGDWQTAYVSYKQIAELEPRLPMLPTDLQRLAKFIGDNEDYRKWVGRYGRRDNLPKDAGEFIMIYQAGRSAIKVSRGPLLSDQTFNVGLNVALRSASLAGGLTAVAVMAALNKAENPIPKWQRRANNISHMVINVNGVDLGRTVMLNNIEDTAIQTFDDTEYPALVKKTIAGMVVKLGASAAGGFAVKHLTKFILKQAGLGSIADAGGNLAGVAAGAGIMTGLIASLKPDLRCWHTLPANLQLSRLFLPAGNYNIKIKFIDKYGRIERFTEHQVQIGKGQKTFFNFRTLY
ncbi:MAG TPA: hypothetical protein PKM65_17540 [Spirochaetota bacterium]|nr:hypothetical protein [Spirochaetota bacterium]HNT11303.1 hypothetical protein [Spirochaetota bacterium]